MCKFSDGKKNFVLQKSKNYENFMRPEKSTKFTYKNRMLAIMCSRSRDPSPVGSEISVGSPSPPPSECERRNNNKIGSDEYFQPLKRLKMVNDHSNDVDNNNHSSSDASRTSSLKSPSSTLAPPVTQTTQTTTTGIEGVKSFSIADILGRDSSNKNNSSSAQATQAAVTAATIVNGLSHLHHHQQVARIVRPWDHLQHPISIRPLLPPALLHYEQRLAMEYHQQLQEHFHAQAQLLRHMNIDIIPSESGSDRSSSVASGDCCSPDIGRSSDNSGRSHPSQQHPSSNNNNNINRNGNKSPSGNAPLDALFQLSNKNFDEAEEEERVNLFAAQPQPKKKRKSRTAFTNHQIFELEKRFLYQKYLSPADRDEIAAGLGLSNAQVITWFQNRRAKLKRDMEELKKDVESVKLLTTQKSFLENVNDMNLLKSKATSSHNHHGESVEKYRSLGETEVNQ